MSQLPSQYVKRGMWVNVEDGPVLGRVITADSRTGTLVIAILAIVTTFGTTHLWNIITFSYHQFRVDSRPRDGLFRQQQAILRTRPTAGALVSDWLKLWWAWRHRAENSFGRSVPQLLLGILFTTGTIAVSLSTSYIISASNIQVLVESPLCGPTVELSQRVFYDDFPAAVEYLDRTTSAGFSYADDCYNLSENTATGKCISFIRPNVPFHEDRVPCPFQNNICAKVDNPALTLDSGLMDLNSQFGLNLPHRDKVKYRRKTTCAVIDVGGRYSRFNDTERKGVERNDYWKLYLGNWTGLGYNATWEVSLIRRKIPAFEFQYVNIPRSWQLINSI